MDTRSHGKLIWVGEHACLNGCPAVVSDIDLWIDVNDGDLYFDDNSFVADFLGVTELGVSVTGNLPMGIGLGYSSALLSSLCKFYAMKYNLNLDDMQILECINRFESFGSGVDSFGVMNEGLYLWNKNSFDKLDGVFFDYFIVNTGCEDSTEVMVDYVQPVDGFIDCIYEFVDGIQDKDLDVVKSSLNKISDLLVLSGAVDAKASKFISWLNEEGFAAKITGAGGKTNGSGAVIGIGRLTNDQKCRITDDFGFEIIYES